MKRFEFYVAPLPEAGFAALGAKPGWKTQTLEVEPGVKLRGLVHAPQNDSAPWVLFFAGNSPTLLAEAQSFLDTLRGTRDFGVAIYAYRGFDGSTGTPGNLAIVRDATQIYGQLRAGLPHSKLHLIGFSLGTAIACAVAAQTTPASVTLLSPLTEIDIVERSLLARFRKGDRFETLRYLEKLAGPVLVIHGDADQAFPVEMGRTVSARLGSRARYLELAGVDHLGLLKDPRTLEAVRGLVEPPP